MKRRWMVLAARIDAYSQRERIMLFAATAAALIFIVHMLVIGPLLHQQEQLRQEIVQQQNNIAGIQTEIASKVEAAQADPDAPLRDRLLAVREENSRLTAELRAMQQGLVAPERMAPLLESILRANGRLKMVSVRTLAVESLSDIGNKHKDESKAEAPAAVKPAVTGKDLLFRHGVELTVRGSYLDIVDYMTALESLPTQLFWGKAELAVEEYPSVRLTLTLYTLSLDEKWMKL